MNYYCPYCKSIILNSEMTDITDETGYPIACCYSCSAYVHRDEAKRGSGLANWYENGFKAFKKEMEQITPNNEKK